MTRAPQDRPSEGARPRRRSQRPASAEPAADQSEPPGARAPAPVDGGAAVPGLPRLTRSGAEFARAGDLSLRPLREREDDYARISRWRSDPRVLEGYGGRDRPLDIWTVMAKLGPKVRGESEVFPCMIERAGRAIGYLQVYPVRTPSEYGLAADEAQDLFGIDLFLGEPDLWGQGLGPIVLRAALDWLFAEQGARKVVIDPRVENERAVRAYEKTGFTRVRRLRAHEVHEGRRRDVWLMVMDRQAWMALPPAPGHGDGIAGGPSP